MLCVVNMVVASLAIIKTKCFHLNDHLSLPGNGYYHIFLFVCFHFFWIIPWRNKTIKNKIKTISGHWTADCNNVCLYTMGRLFLPYCRLASVWWKTLSQQLHVTWLTTVRHFNHLFMRALILDRWRPAAQQRRTFLPQRRVEADAQTSSIFPAIRAKPVRNDQEEAFNHHQPLATLLLCAGKQSGATTQSG